MAAAMLLEGLQALTPDRLPIFWLDYAARARRWRRLCLRSSSPKHFATKQAKPGRGYI
jgi:hypothetical protein